MKVLIFEHDNCHADRIVLLSGWMQTFDVIIVGAGPAGSSACIALRNSGLKIALIDKSIFPRDKVCGDALSLDVLNQLAMLDPKLAREFDSFNIKQSSAGVSFSSSKGKVLDIPFIYKNEIRHGYVCERKHFDHLLFKAACEGTEITVFENSIPDRIDRVEDGFVVVIGEKSIKSRMILGADGAQSGVARKLKPQAIDLYHHSAGLRMYCSGVRGFHSEGYIELHFINKVLPGYLWIFPLPDGKANVGIGVLSSIVRQRKLNLRQILMRELQENPLFVNRFSDVVYLEEPKGFGLPLGSKKRSISGDGFLLLGDAAGLIDPLSGEGIANAIRSGRVAAEHAKKAFSIGQFSASFLSEYDDEIYRKMGAEFKLSRQLQMMCKYPWLMELLFRKAKSNEVFRQFIIDALADVNVKKRLVLPIFWFKLLIGSKRIERFD